jgi:hypothetical protein
MNSSVKPILVHVSVFIKLLFIQNLCMWCGHLILQLLKLFFSFTFIRYFNIYSPSMFRLNCPKVLLSRHYIYSLSLFCLNCSQVLLSRYYIYSLSSFRLNCALVLLSRHIYSLSMFRFNCPKVLLSRYLFSGFVLLELFPSSIVKTLYLFLSWRDPK